MLATAALALSAGIGFPRPGTAERAYGGLLGLLGCLLAMSWLRAIAEGRAPAGRYSPGGAEERDPTPAPPVVEAIRDLERALRLGASTIGSFSRLVQPRLQVLATAKLNRSGIALEDDERARGLLGDGYLVVDPAAPLPEDRMAAGIPLDQIERLVEALEQMA